MKDAFKDLPKKETTNCTSNDQLISGFKRPIFTDRICDGIADCTGLEDELGGLGKCIPFAESTELGCCSVLLVNGAGNG